MSIDEKVKRLSVLMGCLDLLPELLEDVKGSPFYRQRLKNAVKTLDAELEKHMEVVCREAGQVAYTEDWLNLRLLASVYLRCIRKTPIGQLDTLVALLVAWENGEVKIE